MISKGRRTSARFVLALIVTLLGLHGVQPVNAQGDTTQYFRVVILDQQPLGQAQKLKDLLDGLGYSPVILERQGENYRVLYGGFPTQAAAEEAKAKLQNDGITTHDIVQTSAAALPGGEASGDRYFVVVDAFPQRIRAEEFAVELRDKGFDTMNIRKVDRFYEVRLGDYPLAWATDVLKQLRSQNFLKARLEKNVPEPAKPVVEEEVPVPAAAQEGNSISPLITQSSLWKELNDDQKKQVINSVLMQRELGKGDVMAQQVLDMDTRLKNLDDRVRGLVEKIQKEREDDRRLRDEMSIAFKEADHKARAGDFQGAILTYNNILNLDKEDRFGQAQTVRRYISMLQAKINGESYEGQAEDVKKQVEALKSEAEKLSASSNPNDLDRARERWAAIARLNPAQAPVSDRAIAELSARIDQENANATAAKDKKDKQVMYIMGGVALAVLLLVVLTIGMVWFQLRRQESKLTEKVQQQLASQMRPMRELDGGGTSQIASGGGPRLGGPSDEQTDSDIFSPRTMGDDDFQSDPLGGLTDGPVPAPVATRPVKAGKGGKGAAPAVPVAEKDPFATDSLGLDDIFGGSTDTSTAGPTKDSPGEDSFSSLFDTATPPVINPKPATPPKLPAGAALGPKAIGIDEHHEPISFGVASKASEPEDTSDLLSMFDAPSSSGGGGGGGGLDHLKDSPFSALMDDVGGPGVEPTSSFTPQAPSKLDEDTEIPAIKLNVDDSTGGIHSAGTIFNTPAKTAPENDATSGLDDSFDLPSFSLDELTAMNPNVADRTTTFAPGVQETADSMQGGIELSFEDLPAGKQPAGWSGSYDYATLTVETETPPRGYHQYLAFRKNEGNGKALFTHSFPQVTGKVAIEFDLRCDDKNKFLLGFYIEKDGDFQNSINTKILRSEAQTTPTIHMQGESAPYLLGSWAHIKYVVDLDNGLVNGYIDGTHMARDIAFENNPGALNTLAIRDNINTTGVLLLNHIKVYTV